MKLHSFAPPYHPLAVLPFCRHPWPVTSALTPRGCSPLLHAVMSWIADDLPSVLLWSSVHCCIPNDYPALSVSAWALLLTALLVLIFNHLSACQTDFFNMCLHTLADVLLAVGRLYIDMDENVVSHKLPSPGFPFPLIVFNLSFTSSRCHGERWRKEKTAEVKLFCYSNGQLMHELCTIRDKLMVQSCLWDTHTCWLIYHPATLIFLILPLPPAVPMLWSIPMLHFVYLVFGTGWYSWCSSVQPGINLHLMIVKCSPRILTTMLIDFIALRRM